MCYTVSLRETSKFKNKDEIKTKQFSRYLFETPYKVSSKSDNCRIDGGFCIESSNIDDCREKIDVDESYLLVKKTMSARKREKQLLLHRLRMLEQWWRMHYNKSRYRHLSAI